MMNDNCSTHESVSNIKEIDNSTELNYFEYNNNSCNHTNYSKSGSLKMDISTSSSNNNASINNSGASNSKYILYDNSNVINSDQINELKKIIQEKSREIEIKSKKIEKLNADIEELKADKEELRVSKKDISDENELFTKENENLKKKIEKLEQDLKFIRELKINNSMEID